MRIYKYIFSDERKEKDGNGNVASWQTEIIARNKSKENERNIEMKSNATECVIFSSQLFKFYASWRLQLKYDILQSQFKSRENCVSVLPWK